jgi:hypothetical protein
MILMVLTTFFPLFGLFVSFPALLGFGIAESEMGGRPMIDDSPSMCPCPGFLFWVSFLAQMASHYLDPVLPSLEHTPV